ncbi:IclR family transcriptional regulator [Thioclava sp. BHET1]|uniref:Transcriptional regulator n=1 Tax=Thioclava dalianensis TaxID=1185766 RepID=A0A074TC12_9RHOB|nr:IclR family transcriptional regulator [Thioclava dalianensis]KEP69301.1 transcriptional regulator [Thioclava dalianensis]TMV91616.1 IclR family transcriptional regulator [Thioclava sp. BHET1]SFN56182.1 transcriptional regulator, IclR family [Thioclava dalianensis]
MKQPKTILPSSAEKSALGAQSVDRALSLLPLIGSSPQVGLGLGTIVEETGLSRPTARRLLLSLMRSGLIEQDPRSKAYRLGEEAFILGTLAAPRFGLVDIAAESVTRLADVTGDTAYLSMRRDTFSICMLKQDGNFPIRVQALQVGFRHPLGIGAGSLAILSALPDPEVEEILTQNTAIIEAEYPRSSIAILRDAVAQTRARGWSLNPGMVLANSWAVGHAVTLPDGRIGGALSVAAIDSRMTPDRQAEIAAHLGAAVHRVEARLARMFSHVMPPDAARVASR